MKNLNELKKELRDKNLGDLRLAKIIALIEPKKFDDFEIKQTISSDLQKQKISITTWLLDAGCYSVEELFTTAWHYEIYKAMYYLSNNTKRLIRNYLINLINETN